ncbi:lipoamide acyltransferase component of branched-chain alpha-keto acid dehydrogenase complex, mitochondrial [Andrographis paniculata]|uniref:lipoamide acyltransferase component of branched-chain alpha-keto acid dehydrogenase complex, mitochondrial n=1 Tax=Andrographis paniculata TaxID=175694 RepID=UPI0021E9764F|nr:lipoamide acyltransferase component of branched-chain alpha-keto acid dehydrogenase complex, mitochondrial [Andrographis paniculata]
MICGKICRRKSLSFTQWWRCACSASNPPSIAAGATAQRACTRTGFLSRNPHNIISDRRTLYFSESRHGLNYLSSSFGIKGCFFATQSAADLPISGDIDVPLAQTGEGIAECELLKWFVEEGDQVEEFQPLCEVQSDKATIEITSRYRGKVSKTLHVPGDIVKVGETLLKLAVEDASSNEVFEASQITKTPDLSKSDLEVVDSCLKQANMRGILSTPAVRGLAKQMGVNIEDVQGTGIGGRVMKEDVLNYAARAGILAENPATLADASPEKYPKADQIYSVSSTYHREYEDKTIPLRGYQRAMVKYMTLAAKIPHFHYVDEINCNALIELKASFQKENSEPGIKYTFLPVLIKSLSMALSKYPFLNSCFNEEIQEVILKGSHNIGIAMATPHGLVVPNIKNVQHLSIMEITKELARLQQLALANKLSSSDVSGGTITLSNIGAIGGKFGSPLINVPEVVIIAMGRIQTTPVFDEDGNVCPASIMTVNIGADHRVLDGAIVAKFCNEWKRFIEKPELLMLLMR